MTTDSASATVSLTDGPVVLGNGIAGETLPIPTANPTGFHQAITEPNAMPATEIIGSLFLPPGEGPRPVVIVVPGSLGVAPSHVAKADLLTETGIACCVIDPFGTRASATAAAGPRNPTRRRPFPGPPWSRGPSVSRNSAPGRSEWRRSGRSNRT